jgi:UDP:flavonoid glycosyltransferase YjiC (YdhE family)
LRALLIPLGSSGDVHPFVGLGLALARRGHRVTVATNPYFEQLVRGSGLDYHALGRENLDALIRDPSVWHPIRGFGAVMRLGILPLLRDVYDLVAAKCESGDTLVVASGLAFGARIAQEELGVPLATVHLQPAVFRSDHENSKLAGLAVRSGIPRWLKRLQFWLTDRVIVDRVLAPDVNALRSELGLAPIRRLLRGWWHSPSCVVAMFPSWYFPVQPDWPPQTHLVGFPLYDERGVTQPPQEAVEFLAQGNPPIVFTPGSAMVHGREFFAEAVEACRLLGRRGMLLTRFPDQIPASLPPFVRFVPFAPFGWLLPQAAALVHHGGIGSLSQGFAAGIPQLIMPMSHDQPDNADRARRLGVARIVPRRKFKARAVAASLRGLLASPEVAASCRDVQARLGGRNGLEVACDVLEGAFPAQAASGRIIPPAQTGRTPASAR